MEYGGSEGLEVEDFLFSRYLEYLVPGDNKWWHISSMDSMDLYISSIYFFKMPWTLTNLLFLGGMLEDLLDVFVLYSSRA